MQFKWPLYCGGCIFVIYNARLTCLYVVDGVILYIYRIIYTLIIFFIYIFIVRIQCSKISTNYLLLYIYHIFSQYLSFYMKNVLPSLSFLKGDLLDIVVRNSESNVPPWNTKKYSMGSYPTPRLVLWYKYIYLCL